MHGTRIITISVALLALVAIGSAQRPYPRRSGPAAMRSQPQISVTLALDHAVYSAAGSTAINAQLSARNSTPDAVTLTHLTTQTYDLEIRDAKGKVVYLWSAGKFFGQVVTSVNFTGELDYTLTVPLSSLDPGQYVAQAWLTVEGPQRAYSGSVGFEVR
jgi:hypothetical protein